MAKLRTVLLLLSTVAGVMLPASGAAAIDTGDGSEACNGGEICLWRGDTETRYRRHYWYGATYTTEHQWWDSTDNVYRYQVKDSVTSVTNKDTSCSVKMIDVKFGTDGYQRVPNDSQRHVLGSELNDRADKHERCT